MEEYITRLIELNIKNGSPLSDFDIVNLYSYNEDMLVDMIIEAENVSANRLEWNNCLIVAVFKMIGIDISNDDCVRVRQILLSAFASLNGCLDNSMLNNVDLEQLLMSGQPLPDEVIALMAYLLNTCIVVQSAEERYFDDMVIYLGVANVYLVKSGYWQSFVKVAEFFRLQMREIIHEYGKKVPPFVQINHSECHYSICNA